jgi:hypothetical protein
MLNRRIPEGVLDEVSSILNEVKTAFPSIMQLSVRAFYDISTNNANIAGDLYVRYATTNGHISYQSLHRLPVYFNVVKIFELPSDSGHIHPSITVGPWTIMHRIKYMLRFTEIDSKVREYMRIDLSPERFSRISFRIDCESHDRLNHMTQMIRAAALIEDDTSLMTSKINLGTSLTRELDDYLMNYDVRSLMA